MIYVNYYIADIFNHEQFINCMDETDENSIRTAFNAMKKYNATVFIDTDEDTQVEYYFDDYRAQNILNKVIVSNVHAYAPNKSVPVLIDYRTALRDELKKVK